MLSPTIRYQALVPGPSWTPWNRFFVKSQDLQTGEVWTQIFGKFFSFACAQQISQIQIVWCIALQMLCVVWEEGSQTNQGPSSSQNLHADHWPKIGSFLMEVLKLATGQTRIPKQNARGKRGSRSLIWWAPWRISTNRDFRSKLSDEVSNRFKVCEDLWRCPSSGRLFRTRPH